VQTSVGATTKARPPLSVPFFFGWVAVGLSFLTTLVGAGVRSAPTVFIHPLEMEFDGSRAEIGFAVSINLFLYGLAGPLSGWLLDRFGSRRVMAGSLALMAVDVGLTTLMREYWQLLVLWGAVIGLAAVRNLGDVVDYVDYVRSTSANRFAGRVCPASQQRSTRTASR